MNGANISSMKKITIDQVNEFYQYLQGEIPEGFVGVKSPKLSPRRAFNVIYVLQEHLHLLPDHYELCCQCHQLYDSWREGRIIRGRFYCGCCYDTRRTEINYRRSELRRIKKQERLEI